MDIVLRDHPALKANLENAAVKNYGSLGTDLTSQLGSFHETGPALVIGILLTFFGARGVANAMQNALNSVWEVPKAERPARLERLYRFSSLGPFEHRRAGQLSGGMKQKLSLCCALIHHPEVLLLDEPTFGVDPISRRDLWLILHEMVGSGVTVVVSTAYMDEAERCDRVALLDRGRVIALDTPEALQASLPVTVIAVRTSDPRRAAAVLAAVPCVARASLFGDVVHASLADPDRDCPAAEAALAAAGIAVLERHEIVPGLEDVFIHRVSAADGERSAA